MATLKDIAAELGLSPATVSRALNGFPEVGAETKRRVREVAERLDYRPNRLAQRLVTGRSGLIGMVIDMAPDLREDQALFDVVTGLSAELARRDMDLVLSADPGEDRVAALERLVARNLVDGFVLGAPRPDDPRIAYLESRQIPFVVHGRHDAAAGYPYYDVDNADLTRRAVEHLVSLGHRRIALLNGEAQLSFARDRLAGYRAGLEAAGLDMRPERVRHGVLTEGYGHAEGLALLSAPPDIRPTAVLCGATNVAAGLYRAAAELRVEIPGALSVMAHDDAMPWLQSESFDPPLSVTWRPMRDACAPLTELLVRRLAGAHPGTLRRIETAELVIRGSTAPPAAARGLPAGNGAVAAP